MVVVLHALAPRQPVSHGLRIHDVQAEAMRSRPAGGIELMHEQGLAQGLALEDPGLLVDNLGDGDGVVHQGGLAVRRRAGREQLLCSFMQYGEVAHPVQEELLGEVVAQAQRAHGLVVSAQYSARCTDDQSMQATQALRNQRPFWLLPCTAARRRPRLPFHEGLVAQPPQVPQVEVKHNDIGN